MNDEHSETVTDSSSEISLLHRLLGFLENFGAPVVGLALLIWFGIGTWKKLDDYGGYIYHQKLTGVSSRSWASGEYKDCFSLNIQMEQPVLSCDSLLGGDTEKVFSVRFYGETYSPAMPKDSAFEWRCRKNDYVDPALTCEQRKNSQ